MFTLYSVHHDTDPRWFSNKNGRVHILALVTKGRCFYEIDGERVAVTKGEMIYIPQRANRLFREMMGVPPIQYLHQIRLQVASDLLQHTDMTIGQISDAVGFCNQAYFNRMFKKMIGTSPSRVRSR